MTASVTDLEIEATEIKVVEIKLTPADEKIVRDAQKNLPPLPFPTSNNYQSLTTETKGLSGRGRENLEDYDRLPCTVFERIEIAARLRLLLNQNFPERIRAASGTFPDFGFTMRAKLIFGKTAIFRSRSCSYPTPQPGWKDSSLSDPICGRAEGK